MSLVPLPPGGPEGGSRPPFSSGDRVFGVGFGPDPVFNLCLIIILNLSAAGVVLLRNPKVLMPSKLRLPYAKISDVLVAVASTS